jgi:hypothetical protein
VLVMAGAILSRIGLELIERALYRLWQVCLPSVKCLTKDRWEVRLPVGR